MTRKQIERTLILLAILAVLFLISFIIMMFSAEIGIRIASLIPFLGCMVTGFVGGVLCGKLYYKVKKNERNV